MVDLLLNNVMAAVFSEVRDYFKSGPFSKEGTAIPQRQCEGIHERNLMTWTTY